MNMMEQIWKIRDSRGLDTYEKNFLMILASRGEAGMFCEWKRNSEDMGMKKDAYYNRRTSLINKGLITAQERKDNTTLYKINDEALIAWHAAHSVSQNDDSVSQNDRSVTQNEHSVRPERKKNTKINKKKNEEEQNSSVVPPSSLPLNDNKNDKDEAGTAILIGDNPAAGPMDENDEGHSVTQNEDAYYEWNGRKVLRAGYSDPLATVDAAPVEPKVMCPCEKNEVFHDGLCWDCGAAA